MAGTLLLCMKSITERPEGFGVAPGQRPPNFGRRFTADPPTVEEVERLLAACSPRSDTGLRNRAAIVLMWRAGLRLAELLDLKVSDIDPKAGTVRVLHGKGGKARTVALDAGGMAVVQRWVEARKARGIKNGALIAKLEGGAVQPVYVRNLLHRLAEQAGIERRIHPHGLRHACAVEMVRRGVPMPSIQRQLGHASLATTQTYLQGLNPQQAIDDVKAAWADVPLEGE